MKAMLFLVALLLSGCATFEVIFRKHCAMDSHFIVKDCMTYPRIKRK